MYSNKDREIDKSTEGAPIFQTSDGAPPALDISPVIINMPADTILEHQTTSPLPIDISSEEATSLNLSPEEAAIYIGEASAALARSNSYSIALAAAFSNKDDNGTIRRRGTGWNEHTQTRDGSRYDANEPPCETHPLLEPISEANINVAFQTCSDANEIQSQELLGHHFETEEETINFKALAKAFQKKPKTQSSTFEQRISFYSKQTGIVNATSLDSLDISNQKLAIEEVLKKGFFWLSVDDPTIIEVASLAKALEIHPLTSEDILLDDIREKCEGMYIHDISIS